MDSIADHMEPASRVFANAMTIGQGRNVIRNLVIQDVQSMANVKMVHAFAVKVGMESTVHCLVVRNRAADMDYAVS